MDRHRSIGAAHGFHVFPEFVEKYRGPGAKPGAITPATNLLPSADMAMELQFVIGALVSVQF